MSKVSLDKLGVEAITKKGWLVAHKYLLTRRFVQLGILFLFVIGPIAGFTILKGNLSSSLLLGFVPMTDPMLFLQMLAGGYFGMASSAIIGAALVLMFYMIVGGRVYCSWVCPVNIITDSAHWLRRKLGIKGGQKLSTNVRYWILGLVFVMAFATGNLAWELVNPVSMLHRGLIFGFGFGWVIVFGIFLFDVFVARHGWCGHLCPVGAFYGLVGSVAPVRVLTPGRAACDDCMECYEVCPEPQVLPMALKGAENGYPAIIVSAACTNCGRCLDICAKDVFQFGLRYKSKKVDRFTFRQIDDVGVRN
ncbi:MAG: quinol dehydrogenase ferredoxin subunit NapH [Proteobacteria bacterium]|nr:quinol dehydrogenase ferredoxin subunit NapH [Pseudomonadota bacterium]